MRWLLPTWLICLVVMILNILSAQAAPPAGGSLSPSLLITPALGQQKGDSCFYLNARRPIVDYRSFMISSPPRFVLELANCDVRSPGVLPGDHWGFTRVRIGRTPGKVRFVFDLPAEPPTAPKVVPGARGLKIVFRNPGLLPPMPDRQLSFSFYRCSIRDFFEYVDALCDFTIRLAPDIDEKLTMNFRNMALAEAVRHLLDAYKLELVREKDDVYLVRRQLAKT